MYHKLDFNDLSRALLNATIFLASIIRPSHRMPLGNLSAWFSSGIILSWGHRFLFHHVDNYYYEEALTELSIKLDLSYFSFGGSFIQHGTL